MPSLIGADAGSGVNVAANYLKTSPSTQFGTRALKFVKVVVSGGTPVDLTKQTGSSGAYTDANSYFSTAVRTIQQYAEIYAVGRPATSGGLSFTVVVADDTQNSAGTPDAHVQDGTYSLLEAALLAALGNWSSGVVTLTAMDLNGINLA